MVKAIAAVSVLLLWTTEVNAQYVPPTPNIIFIVPDDLTEKSFTGTDASGTPFMPYLAAKKMEARRFENFIFTQSMCVPSRTTYLTGQYPHNHGVTNNGGPEGGYDRYMEKGLDQVSFPNLLSDYYSAHLGKFLNNYPKADWPAIPAGWDYWLSIHKHNMMQMFNWTATENDTVVTFSGATDEIYQTNVIRDKVKELIQQQSVYQMPYVMQVASTSPHGPSQPSLQYTGLYANEPFAPGMKPSFNEADKSDKVHQTPLFTTRQINKLTIQWRNSLESARSIDDMLQSLFQVLDETGQSAYTFVFFVPDNGKLWGEHGFTKKTVPYRESIKTTAIVWGPGVIPGVDRRLVANIDVMPTFMEIAGKPIPASVDGRSLLPLLKGQPISWRKSVLVQGIAPADTEDGVLDTTGNAFSALISRNEDFIEFDAGIEFYNVKNDPYQLNSVVPTPEAVQAYQQRIDAHYACAGETCRVADQ